MVSELTAKSRLQYDPGTPYEVPVADTSLITLLETSARLYPERRAECMSALPPSSQSQFAQGRSARMSREG